jgi:cytochrome c oxidase subunit 4
MAHSQTDSHEHGHVIGLKIHLTILLVLMFFTAVTVWAAGINFGNPNFNILVAMFIATIKAALVGMYFMHLRYENPLIWMYVAIPVIILFIMIGGLFLDNPTRTVPGKSSYIVSRADGEPAKKSHDH